MVNRTIAAEVEGAYIFTQPSPTAMDLWNKGRFGVVEKGRLRLSLLEGVYLVEVGKLRVKQGRGVVGFGKLVAYAKKREKNFWVRYKIYSDLRTRGYIIKTALKFGADFRVYERGVKPGQDHAKWVVYPVYENECLVWSQFAAKSRVAHSTKKRLLIGVLDEEDSITYYEIEWKRP